MYQGCLEEQMCLLHLTKNQTVISSTLLSTLHHNSQESVEKSLRYWQTRGHTGLKTEPVFILSHPTTSIKHLKTTFTSFDPWMVELESCQESWQQSRRQKELDDLSCCSLAISKSSSDLSDSRRPIIYCSMAQLALQQASGYLMQMFPNKTNGKYQQALSNCSW